MAERSRCVVCAVAAVVLVATAFTPGPSRGEEEPPRAEPQAEFEERYRKAELLASDRWRRAMFELDEWLAVQPVYTPEQVRRMKADLERHVKSMTSYELDYLLDTLEFKLRILDSPEAIEAREWLGRYLSVMSDRKRAEVLAHVPNVVEMTSGQLIESLEKLEARRAAVAKTARDMMRGRREFAAFERQIDDAEELRRTRLSRIRRGDVSFSPYRAQPIGEPPFAEAYGSPTVIGVGPWGTFIGTAIGAF